MSPGPLPQCFGLSELNINFLALLSEMAWENLLPSTLAPLRCFCFPPMRPCQFLLWVVHGLFCSKTMHSTCFHKGAGRMGEQARPTATGQATRPARSWVINLCLLVCVHGVFALPALHSIPQRRTGRGSRRPSQQPLLLGTEWGSSGPVLSITAPQSLKKSTVEFI